MEKIKELENSINNLSNKIKEQEENLKSLKYKIKYWEGKFEIIINDLINYEK